MAIPVNELRLSQIYFDGKNHVKMVGFGRRTFLVEDVDVWGDAHIGDNDMCVAVEFDLPAYGGRTIVGRKACVFAASALSVAGVGA